MRRAFAATLENWPWKIFGKFVQLYVTTACGMMCPSCNSRKLKMEDMTLETLGETVEMMVKLGIDRLELFANDPAQHPLIFEFIDLLNKSNLKSYGVLTVGKSPADPRAEQIFRKALDLINPDKGSFVFSVNHTMETASKIVSAGQGQPGYDYAFKALAFWEYTELLKKKGVGARINIVVSASNHTEVEEIIRRAAKMGFSVSFCYEQSISPRFSQVMKKGFTLQIVAEYRKFLYASKLLSREDVNRMISRGVEIATRKRNEIFNTFRSEECSGFVPESELRTLRKLLLQMKADPEIGSKILPSEAFISDFGGTPNGCLQLLRSGIFSQIKIDSRGNIKFCCDLAAPELSAFNVRNLMDDGAMEKLAEAIRTNPYIWFCLFFNACSFSVNYVNLEPMK